VNEPLKNSRHERFAWGIARGMTQEEAYREAGYSPKSSISARACASKLLTIANISQRIKEISPEIQKELKERFAERAIVAFRVLDDIAVDPEQPSAQRVSAAKHILGLAGHVPVEKSETDVNVEVSWSQIIKRVKQEKGKEA